MPHDDTPNESPYALETDGIIHGLATACVNVLTEAAAIATPERFIHLAAHQVTTAGQEATAERVGAHLYSTLQALDTTTKRLHAL